MSRVRSWLAAPMGARLLGVACAVAGVALLVLGVFAFGGSGSDGSAAPPAPTTAGSTVAPTSRPGSTTTSAPTTTAPPASPTPRPPSPSTTPPRTSRVPVPVRVPLTVLNNSTVRGLGERAAGEARSKGWTVASVGNFAGVIPVTTVYYTAGNATEQAAAEQLKADLPQIERVMTRYEGLPPTPTGVVLVVTRDWS